jgi:hypothetical protein
MGRRILTNATQLAAIGALLMGAYMLLPLGWFLVVLAPVLFVLGMFLDPDRGEGNALGVKPDVLARAIHYAKFYEEPAPGRDEGVYDR